jgi:hypothetical protein
MKVRYPLFVVAAVGLLGVQPALGVSKPSATAKSSGDSANAVYVRGGYASPGNCGQMTNLVDNLVVYDGNLEVVIKSSGKAIEVVEEMDFRILNNGKEVASGDLDVIKDNCGNNGIYTIVALDAFGYEGLEDEEDLDLDDDNWISRTFEGSITIEILDNNKKFGSDSLRIG